MAATPPVCDFGWKAVDFTLPATEGKTYALTDIAGPNGLLLMFICNHCPYVLRAIDRIVRDGRELQALGIGVAAICSNDAVAYPADSFENMAVKAEEWALPFPYLHDADQSVARAYDAACTPDFYGFNAAGELQYRGRLDAARAGAAAPDLRRDLFEAMKRVSETGRGPEEQVPSMGCSIKWK
ncbi:thioredoxin family protein [Tropicimonas sp. TH_r6]|uniref:thioredoxin family protein n=1 Tax=Tropicimonas sp. TH_r6 TaxID=3082085 RepID=UPI00295586D3|nr:thioredoxin family protein [Tropicimonas sp. TH_r6]MDV7141611.1 thioredoxin family protein [Tropicimonas sp. TH_r6]